MTITIRKLSNPKNFKIGDIVKGFGVCSSVSGRIIDKKEINNIINTPIYLYKVVLNDNKTRWCNGLYLTKIEGVKN